MKRASRQAGASLKATGGNNSNELLSKDFRELNLTEGRESLGQFLEEGMSQASSGEEVRFGSSAHISQHQKIKVNVTVDHR